MRFRAALVRPVPLVAAVVLYTLVLTAYTWTALPTNAGLGPVQVVFFLFAVGFPLVVNAICGDRLPDSGWRLDNLRASTRAAFWPALGVAALELVVALAVDGIHSQPWSRIARRAGRYALWGPVQQ